jgi:hypothetical protein
MASKSPSPPEAAAGATEPAADTAPRQIELTADHAELRKGARLIVVPNDQGYGEGEVTEYLAEKLVRRARVARFVPAAGG